jgi:hypothetical protein
VQVGDEHVETLDRDQFQSFGYVLRSDYLKTFTFKGGVHHGANGIIVIH